MPARKTFVKPDKSNLLVKMGRKDTPETADGILKEMGNKTEASGVKHFYPKKHPPVIAEPEVLDEEGVAQKRALIDLLTKLIIPNALSSRSTPEQDKRSLVLKLNRCELKELKGLVPDRIKRMSVEKLKSILDGTDDIKEEEKVEIQSLYMDISP